MNAVVFGKTTVGQDEIQQRTMRLHPRLRSLLVVIDGKQTVEELLKTLAPMGVSSEHIEQLRDLGLIEAIGSETATVAMSVEEPVTEAPRVEVVPADENPSELDIDIVPSDDAGRMLILYRIFHDTVKASFGLRGFTYQMSLEKASTLEDYVNLGNDILRALEKSKGSEAASKFKTQVKPYFS